MKPSRRILNLADKYSLGDGVIRSGDIVSAVLDYLDELHEQRESGPELWAVVAVDADGATLHTETFTTQREARTCLVWRKGPEVQQQWSEQLGVKVAEFRLARFRGEFVDP